MKWIPRFVESAAIVLLLMVTIQPVTIKSYPANSFAPTTVRITVHVERSEDNRRLQWACLSTEGWETKTDWQLDGKQSFATKEVLLKDLPAGDYICQARLETSTGTIQSSPTEFHVLGRE